MTSGAWTMEFSVLGRLEVRRDGASLPLGSSRQRELLALLLMHANQVVSTDRILDELWGDDPAADRHNALWVHVSNLRSALEPERPRRSEGTVLLTRAPGYLLHVEPEALDAWRFERALASGRALLNADPAAASAVLAEALALWRGHPYEELAYESFVQPEIARLEELRLEAVELRLEADLRRGLAAELVGELEGLVRQHPLRERLTADLMVALYRSGRQAEALRAYQQLRGRLADELGLDPSDELRRLEERIVVGDPALDLPKAPVASQAGLGVRGYELREPLGEGPIGVTYRAYQPTVGREVAVKVVRRELANDPAFIRRFEADAELVARLEHPHIVPLYDSWREPDAAYLVMRLLRGGNLAGAVARAPLAPGAAAQVVEDVASALAFAHRAGIVHGAVKPSNILLDEQGRAYLGDFALAAELGTMEPAAPTAFVSPERRTGGPVTPASDVYGLGAVLAFALTGQAPDDAGRVVAALPGPVAEVVRAATALDPGRRYADVTAFATAVRAALGPPPAGVESAHLGNPYKGLRAFDEADAADFFGRERLVERLLARLGETGTRGRFVALVGASGSGKSSAVRAGLVPALRHGALPGSAEWFVVTIVPGRHPYEELEVALRRLAVSPPPLLDVLLQHGIGPAVRRVLPDERSQVLLVIDQLEELFTLAPEPTARAFLDAVAAAVDDARSRLKVVVTLRADFYDRPLRYRAIGELLRRGTEVITPMAPDELQRAISGPAERLGVRFEPGLVAEIVADVADRPGALPLLQYALTELFERRRGSNIELSAYRQTGGVSGALARRAEALYAGLDAATQATTRQVLLRLVTLGEGTDDLRRRVLCSELTGLGDPRVDEVLDVFGRHRLLGFDRDPVTRGPTVEIAHEALLTEWARLAGWIDRARDDMRQQRRLQAAAAEWHAGGQDDAYLLRGTQLDLAAAWAADTDLALAPPERAFLEASIARRDAERAADEQRRRHEQQLRRTARRRTREVVAIAVVLAVVVALAVFAWTQRREADRLAGDLAGTNEALAASDEARRLAATATGMADTDPDLAMLLALQALETSERAGIPAVPEAEDALHWAVQGARLTYPVTDAAVEVRIGPQGRTGVFRLPLADLVAMAHGHLTRTLTPTECEQYGLDPCPTGPGQLASPSASGGAAVPRAADRAAPPASDQPLAGTRVTVYGVMPRSDGLDAEFARFSERTGIEVIYATTSLAEEAIDAGADLIVLPQPARVLDAAREGTLVDLATYLDRPALEAAVGPYLVELASDGTGVYAVPFDADLKGLVWYPASAFEQAGYEVPATWADLVALSEQMVADGRTPWCLGFEDGSASGWIGTDWVEALVLRLGGLDAYDRWVDHELAFTDPVVREAFESFGDIAFGEGFVLGGSAGISLRNVWGAAAGITGDPPECWLYFQGDFATQWVAGTDLTFFPLPPVEGGAPAPLFGGGKLLGALTDRPEVRAFVQWLLDPAYGEVWAADPATEFLPANVDFDCQVYAAEGVDAAIGAVRVAVCEQMVAANAEGRWRFDGSDLMPGGVGSFDEDFMPGAFWIGMLDDVDHPDRLDQILTAIDAAWPTG